MDLGFRYWDFNENLVRSRYYMSSFLGHATNTDLLNHLKDVIIELPLANLFQASMGVPNVNLELFEEFSANFNSNCSRSLVDMETCYLHVVHGSFKAGEVASGWGLKKSWEQHRLFYITVQREEKIMQVLAQLSALLTFVLLGIKCL